MKRSWRRQKTNFMSAIANVIPLERIEHSIFLIRGHKVMLSIELANLYQVEPRALIQAIKRNLNRFPSDFMFQLTAEEFENLKSQFVISSWGGVRTPPYAFTEQGIAMLSSVLNSDHAVQVNIEIMRASCGCGSCWRPTLTSRASWKRWRRNTTRSSRLCSTPSGS